MRSARVYVCTGSVVDEELALQISHRVGLASGEKRIESYVGLVDRNSKVSLQSVVWDLVYNVL